MKTMTCKQLGGACDETFQAETFEEMAALSKAHGMQMHAENDGAHQAAMAKMQELMKDPKAMQAWYEDVQRQFDELSDED